MYFKNLKIKNYHHFHSKVEMGDECDKQLNLRIFDFDEKKQEQKLWKLLDVCVIDFFKFFLCHFCPN